MSGIRFWLPYVLAMLLFFGIAACIPPLATRAFVAVQRRLGNGDHPKVRRLAERRWSYTRGVWAIWVLGAVVALPAMARDVARDHEAAAATPSVAAEGDGWMVTVPGPGTPPREGILDAVRDHLGITSELAVDHVAMTAMDTIYAFVRATEVVPVAEPDGEQQETDLTVMALLELPPGGAERRWRVAEVWTLPGEHARPRREFVRRVRDRQRAARLPAALFPADL
jgi:hypothetical protein